VTAPLVGANKTSQIDDAVALLDLKLTGDELASLKRPYTRRYDFQGISDEADLRKVREQTEPAISAEETSGRQSAAKPV